MQLDLPLETIDLRNIAPEGKRASHSPYVAPAKPCYVTDGLPIGSQSRFIDLAMCAARNGNALNALVTIRWRSLFSDSDVNQLRVMPPPDRITYIMELVRKWLKRNGLPCFYIWVRESAGHEDEHFHFALHLSQGLRGPFAAYISKLLGEAKRHGRPPDATEGEYARGEASSWHFSTDTRPEKYGVYLVAYLGKGEPSQRLFRGKLINNADKHYRGESYGGTFPDGQYDQAQGQVLGTACRKYRFFISNELKRLKK